LRELQATSRLASAEVPRREPEARLEPVAPTVAITRSSEWVAGLQRAVRELAERQGRPPLVRAMLDGGEQLFLQAVAPGPAGDFVTFTAYEPGHEAIRIVVLRLDAIQRIDILAKAPGTDEEKLVFEPRPARVGFA
jgi:hypothetical protein